LALDWEVGGKKVREGTESENGLMIQIKEKKSERFFMLNLGLDDLI